MARRPLSPFLVAWLRNHRRLSISSAFNEVSSPSLLSQPVSSAPDTIYLTENCIRKMKELQSTEPEKSLLRLGVDSGGCAGYKYVFKFDSTTNSDDRVFEKDGVKLVVDGVSYDHVRGATVDYEEELISSAFVVAKNPKAKGGCGCQKSFTFIE